jgi:protein-disulfide isomerase
MRQKLAIIFSIALISILVSSHVSASAMEMIEPPKDPKKKTTEKKTDKKSDKKTTKKKTKLKFKAATKKDMADKKMTEKVMPKKTMADKKPTSLGGVDLTMASPVEGSPDAKITIIEFGDYQCPKCFSWFTKEKPTIQSQYIDTGKVNLYFVDIPFLGSDSDSAAVASYCADEQEKYWEYHSKLYKNQGGIQSGWASSDNLKRFASEIGLDSAKFNSCLDSSKYSDKVKHNRNVATSNDVQGTPTFLIVGPTKTEKISGPQPASVFSSVIDKMLK